MMKILFLIATLFSFSALAADRPVIMLTGYWKPTNEMLRRFSANSEQNPTGWVGENWEGRGYDVQAYFPEFPPGSGTVGRGDFQVDYADTREDFARITELIQPISIISFGKGAGPWEIETNATDYKGGGPVLKNSLPFYAIADSVKASGSKVGAWVDFSGDAGNIFCGFLSHLGAKYHREHASVSDPARNISQGFIHVASGYPTQEYDLALKATLRAVIEDLDSKR